MQFSVATVLALAASVSAYAYSNGTQPVTSLTVTVDTVVTVCPGLATVVVGGQTYANTKTTPATITYSAGPYTVVTPVYTRSSVYCNNCPAQTYAPAPPAPVYPVNSTAPAPPAGSGAATPSKPSPPATVPASGANKAFAMSGASLVGLMGLAAYLL